MHRLDYNRDFLMSLSEFLDLLPNVKPRKARAKLKEWQEEILEQVMEDMLAGKDGEIYDLNIGKGIVLSSDDFEHIFYDDDFSATKITPHGAKYLIEIYGAGLFELAPRKNIENVSSKAIDYSKSEQELLKKQKLADEAKNAKKREHEDLINCPQNINPENFTIRY